MVEQTPHPRTDLSALWAEYKELASRHLPERTGRFLRSRRFDRLLLIHVAYSCALLAITAIYLLAGTDLLEHLPGWQPHTSP
jgi:hypothetical protein